MNNTTNHIGCLDPQRVDCGNFKLYNVEDLHLIPVTVYCDDTDLFTEEECEIENLCDLEFPEEIVREWYKKHEDDFIEEQRTWCGKYVEPSFETWLNEAYTADSTLGLYDFALTEYEFQTSRYGPIAQVEVCPHCGAENTYWGWDPERSGYIVNCRECGEEIFLCDACFHSEDNPCQKCDWCELADGGKCFRGRTKLRNSGDSCEKIEPKSIEEAGEGKDTTEEKELKKRIAETTVYLMHLLDECADFDFIDEAIDAIKYNSLMDSPHIAEYWC